MNRPTAYDGKLIEVRGYLLQEFENSALYDRPNWQRSKGIWITPTAEMAKQRGKLNHSYVSVAGIFSAKDHGHLGQFEGTLTVSTFRRAQEDSVAPEDKGPK